MYLIGITENVWCEAVLFSILPSCEMADCKQNYSAGERSGAKWHCKRMSGNAGVQ